MTRTPVDAVVGSLLGGRFRVESLLGRGGMATVYLATDESLGRSVAVKLFRRDLADGEDLRRQSEEIQLLASLNHPGLVTLFDAATDDALGSAFLVMELVSGDDLRTRLAGGPIARSEVAVIGQTLAEALAYIHSRGVIHRDIKPGNILLPERDVEHTGPQAKLTDFGIARIVDGSHLTATGTVIGTAGYFSPEQAMGEGVSAASDVYSLGLVLLECLTGERAFPGPTLEAMMARVTRDPEIPERLGDDWVALLRGMTTRAAEDRPSAMQVAAELAAMPEQLEATMVYPAAQNPAALNSAANSPAPDAGLAETELMDPVADQGSRTALQTEVMSPPPAQPMAAPPPASKAAVAKATDSPIKRRAWSGITGPWRRWVRIAGAIAALLLVVWVVSLAVSALSPVSAPPITVPYPVIDGQLGTHLEQLQRSIEP